MISGLRQVRSRLARAVVEQPDAVAPQDLAEAGHPVDGRVADVGEPVGGRRVGGERDAVAPRRRAWATARARDE